MLLIDFLYLRYFMNKTCSFTATPIISWEIFALFSAFLILVYEFTFVDLP